MATELARKECIPCKGGVLPLAPTRMNELLGQLEGWSIVREHHLEREISFPDFKSALEFVNAVGDIAETENHHPDIYLSYGKVIVQVWTHKIDGLTESDFIFAAKVDETLSHAQRA